MYIIINKKHIKINHVMEIKRVGAVFPKSGVDCIIIKNGRHVYDLSEAGEICRVHVSMLDDRKDGDAFMYIDGEWIRVDLNTVDFVSRKY